MNELHAHTLARMIRGCIVETINFSAENEAAALDECDRRNRWPAGTTMGGKWVLLGKDGSVVPRRS